MENRETVDIVTQRIVEQHKALADLDPADEHALRLLSFVKVDEPGGYSVNPETKEEFNRIYNLEGGSEQLTHTRYYLDLRRVTEELARTGTDD